MSYLLELGERILRINAENGWDVATPIDCDNPRKLAVNITLIHSEVSEATEALRKGDQGGFTEELADVIIRTLDTATGLGVDLTPIIEAKLEKNATRGFRHGGKLF